MNRDNAKNILMLYRPGTADGTDPEIAEALALAKNDAELVRWFEGHCARQNALREKFRQISAPDGLKEQIISEQAARGKIIYLRRNIALAAAAIIVGLLALASFWLPERPLPTNTFAVYQRQMASIALRGYSMDLTTNSSTLIRNYLAQKSAPADFALPTGLQNAQLTGCAVEDWQDAKVSMVCFRTGRALPPGQQSDLWLFVVDKDAVKNLSASTAPQLAKVSRLITASWTQNGRLYLLGVLGDEQTIRKYL